MRIVFLRTLLLVAWSSVAILRTASAGEPEKSPNTLVESILGNGGTGQGEAGARKEDRLDPDRPHLPEATTTVGLGRAVLESGYTFTSKGASFASHSMPEALLRVGVLAD